MNVSATCTWGDGPDVLLQVNNMYLDDLDEAYYTVCSKYGRDVANFLLVAALRRQLNDKPHQWPPPEDLIDKVNDFLQKKGLCQP